MSAPLRRNGHLVKHIVRGCESKRRYSDEYGARAAGQIMSKEQGYPLYLYGCPLCKGFHLTKKKMKAEWRNVDYQFTAENRATKPCIGGCNG